MREIVYDYEKFRLRIKIPEEIELFMKAAHINEDEVLNKNFWQMMVEDEIFFSHEKHPSEEGYVSFGPSEPLSKSKEIIVLIHGFYLTSRKIFELEPKDFEKKEPIITSSCNIHGGWRIYYSFYE